MQKIEKVDFETSDGFIIKGNLVKKGKDAVLMLHQFQLNKSTYDNLSRKLADKNFTALAIDLRGHAESTQQRGEENNFRSFSENDFRDMEKDVEAAKNFLGKNGFKLKYIIGASIGANTALNFAANDKSIEKIVLLSAGLNYKGIIIENNAKRVFAKTLIVASEEDSYSFSSCEILKKLIPNSEFEKLKNSGHGTYMLKPDLEKKIINYLGTGSAQ